MNTEKNERADMFHRMELVLRQMDDLAKEDQLPPMALHLLRESIIDLQDAQALVATDPATPAQKKGDEA